MTQAITEARFLRRIAEDIDDIDTYLVYADWLQQQGDPRGEFILLCHRADPSANGAPGYQNRPTIAATRNQYLEDWGDKLLGDLHGPYQRGAVALSWRLGFIDRLTIRPGPDAQAILDGLPSQPSCRFLRYLDLNDSGITTLPAKLGKLRQVREIDLRACSLEQADIEPPWQHLNRVWASEPPVPGAFPDWEEQPFNWRGPFWLLAGCYQTAVEDIDDEQLRAVMNSVERDEEHYLVNLSDWSPAIGVAQAREDDLELSYRHWLVIAFLRVYYDLYQIAPAVRVLTKAIGKALGKEWGNSKALYELFPYGPAKQACRYAGLPKPTC
jgi:tRNA 2-thiouridine synthesizing protein E